MKRENYQVSSAVFKLLRRDWSSLNLEIKYKASEMEEK